MPGKLVLGQGGSGGDSDSGILGAVSHNCTSPRKALAVAEGICCLPYWTVILPPKSLTFPLKQPTLSCAGQLRLEGRNV
jgi:hypothetical protein